MRVNIIKIKIFLNIQKIMIKMIIIKLIKKLIRTMVIIINKILKI